MDGKAVKIVENFCYLNDSIGAGVIARAKNGWNKFKELLPLLSIGTVD